MSQFALLISLPIFALVFLTFIVLFTLGRSRFKAATEKKLDPTYYKLYRGDGEPDSIRQISRNLINLFETPTIFYVAIVLTIVLKIEVQALLYMAWVYVALRLLHSYIHCSSNKVMMRFRVYILSIVCLLAYWITLLVSVVQQLN